MTFSILCWDNFFLNIVHARNSKIVVILAENENSACYQYIPSWSKTKKCISQMI